MHKIPSKRKTPELLAPAGSLASGITAIDYGADAIYAGLGKFNARERTENFTLEEMSKMIAYAHKFSRKVYIAFNTLIKESEIEEAASSIFEISKLRPDAVIVQDIGILHLIKTYFPFIPIHASTQMGIHNSAGVNFAKKMGIKRVILERQLTFDEIKAIRKNSDLELEVFVHGALCCSISGNCILSSWTGGYSGNRGKCKQPCRKPYTSGEETLYALSSKDLCSIDNIAAYKDLGIHSFKIEGRLRKPDYIKSVVSAYRAVLDSDSPDTLRASNKLLQASPGRKSTHGFKNKDSFKDMTEPNELGITGHECGKVLGFSEGGFKAHITSYIHIGDRVRVQPKSGEEGEAFTITQIICEGEERKSCSKGKICFIKTSKRVPLSGVIYKIGESGGDMVSAISNLPLIRHKINLDISVSDRGLKVAVPGLEHLLWTDNENIAEALKQPLTKEKIAEEFKSSRSDQFETGRISVEIKGNLFLPASVLKQKRRDFWEYILPKLDESFFFMNSINGYGEFKKYYASEQAFRKEQNSKIRKTILIGEKQSSPYDDAVISNTLEDFDQKTQEITLPEFCFEFDLERVKRIISIAVSKGIKNFRVTSLYQLELLIKHKGLTISLSYPLPTVNSLAVREMKISSIKASLKLQSVQAWIELERLEVENFISRSTVPVEIYRYGRPFLFVTRAHLRAKELLKDHKNSSYIIKKETKKGLAFLYGEKPFKTDGFEENSSFYDIINSKLDEEETHSLNLNYSLF